MAKKKTTSKKKTSPRKSAPAKKSTSKKAATKKTATKAAQKKAVRKSASKKASGKKAATRKKASDYLKRPSHTPAIFKVSSKRPAAILFTMEDVRDVLKKRAREDARKKKEETNAKKKAVKATEQAAVEVTEPPKKSKHQAASLEDILGLSSSGPGTGPGSGKVPRKFQKYYNLLMELRREVRDELNLHTSDTLKRSQKEDAGDIAISVDAGTDNFDRDFALSLLSSEQEALNEIEAAIDRIHKGTYGVCEVTGEPIKPDRLEAVPFTRFSVEGQKQYEMNFRKRVSRAGAFLNEASGEKITFGDDDGDN
jgi:DnaK suppressor protein